MSIEKEVYEMVRDLTVGTARMAVDASNVKIENYREVLFKTEVLKHLGLAIRELERWHEYANPFNS